ncbi:MAG: cation transporter [Deltaproteobacteria bacterium HGW-Deltaproteobacteria-4]|nr:MAG: cation transporter [Deltaproteobacteria bacterium HGW-Deltaproteobacteria-4]
MNKVVTFIVMAGFWILMSGMFDAFHLSLGLLCCLLIAFLSADLLFGPEFKVRFSQVLGMIIYLPWLFWQILLSNLQVAYIVLHPRMLEVIDPQLVRFRTRLKGSFARVTLAQSITLTPGTITVNLSNDEFTVYALTAAAASDLPGEMEERLIAALEKD